MLLDPLLVPELNIMGTVKKNPHPADLEKEKKTIQMVMTSGLPRAIKMSSSDEARIFKTKEAIFSIFFKHGQNSILCDYSTLNYNV
jgi:hypothetical protein